MITNVVRGYCYSGLTVIVIGRFTFRKRYVGKYVVCNSVNGFSAVLYGVRIGSPVNISLICRCSVISISYGIVIFGRNIA